MRSFPVAPLATLAAALGLLTGCGTDLEETTFTCDIGDACAEYDAVDAETANDLKLDCGGDVSDGFTCSGYAYVCYHEGETADACTWTNDPYADEACTATYGQTSCPW